MNAFPFAVLSMGATVWFSAVAFCAPTRGRFAVFLLLAIVAAWCFGGSLAVFILTPAYD